VIDRNRAMCSEEAYVPLTAGAHTNSVTALRDERDAGNVSRPCASILTALGADSLTDRQILHRLRLADPNSVRPRISEMIQAGVLVEVGSAQDSESGKTVRVVAAATMQGRLF
jgi:hypothetical protein